MADPEKSVRKLISALNKIPNNMRGFSRSMRTLYAEKAMSSISDTGMRFNELRDQTRRDAMIYLKGVLPFAVTVVRSISEFFDYYDALNFGDWRNNFEDIKSEVGGNKECCDVVLQLHDSIKMSLKNREREVNIILDEYEKQCKMQKSRLTPFYEILEKRGPWWVALGKYCAVLWVNYYLLSTVTSSSSRSLLFLEANGLVFIEWLIASKLFPIGHSGEKNNGNDEAKLNTDALRVVMETTVPALAKFIDGLQETAAFFSDVERDFEYLEDNPKSSFSNEMKLHYDLMKKTGPEVKSNCLKFFAILPEVESDFLAIADDSMDKYYVDKWLEEQKSNFFKQYQCSTPQLRRMMENFSIDAASKLMDGKH